MITKIKKICNICGNVFFVTSYTDKMGWGQFCSQKCMGIGRTGEKSPIWKGGGIKKICLVCKKEFTAPKKSVEKGYGKYCSHKCKGKIRSTRMMGKNNQCWRGGISKDSNRLRTSEKYMAWKLGVFERDNFTCQKCGDRCGNGNPVYLQAHHIKKFSYIVKYIKKKLPLIELFDACIAYPPLWDISNGVTLCKKCHKLRHNSMV